MSITSLSIDGVNGSVSRKCIFDIRSHIASGRETPIASRVREEARGEGIEH